MQNLSEYFKKSDLIPAIIQDIETDAVLMLAFVNEESLRHSLETGYTWFYSRSRGELWNKGGTSGNKQKIIEAYADCDDDTLLFRVLQEGEKKACHTGNYSCFYKKIETEK
jgi:phosphoribosyl-AMP cyclohydrolase/phosphoribosyl-ATP pyrophosphohydrolase/phosphoribosyl-AMP cyclohydrolase